MVAGTIANLIGRAGWVPTRKWQVPTGVGGWGEGVVQALLFARYFRLLRPRMPSGPPSGNATRPFTGARVSLVVSGLEIKATFIVILRASNGALFGPNTLTGEGQSPPFAEFLTTKDKRELPFRHTKSTRD